MYTMLGMTIPQMLTATYLEVPILGKYRIEHVDSSTFGKGSLAVIEQGGLLYGARIEEDTNTTHDYQMTVDGKIYQPVGVNYGYTIFINGMYHKYPESVDRPMLDEICLKDYKPLVTITEYFLKLL